MVNTIADTSVSMVTEKNVIKNELLERRDEEGSVSVVDYRQECGLFTCYKYGNQEKTSVI